MKHKEEKKPELFTIPQEISWHFERTLKPDDKTIGNYVLIQPGASDIVKVLKAYFHHPVPGYNIASIEIVYNEQQNRVFFGHMKGMNGRKGNFKWTPTWRTETQGADKQHREVTHQALQQLAAAHADPTVPNVTILPLWHGTSEEVSDHIFTTGYGIFNSNNPQFVTDEGFFGRGVYTAHEAEYSFRCYAKKHGDKAVLLLNWVSLFEAYPIIEGDMSKVQGKPLAQDNCDAHFIPVRSDFHPKMNTYYACGPNETANYHEVVVFNPAQCLPRYRVKLLNNTPKPSIDDMALTNYQMGLDLFGLCQYAQLSNAFEDAHHANHPGAVIRLHWLHSGGSGVISANPHALSQYQAISKETRDWLKSKASFKGDNDQEAQFLLGWCHQYGLGTDVNLAKAAQYYWIAATQGHRDAHYQFGVCCSAGIGVQQNMKAAIDSYEKAAVQNHIHAHYVLSQCYTLGLGVSPDPAKATLHRQAAQKGRHPLLGSQPLSASSATTATITAATTGGMNPTLPLPSAQTPPPLSSPPTAEITHLKTTLAQKESQLMQKESELKQQRDLYQQHKVALEQDVNQLKQALQNKDKTLAEKDKTHQQQQQVLLNQQHVLHSKDQELGAKEKEIQLEKQKVTELSAKLDRVSNDLTQKLSELNTENQDKELENQQLSRKIAQLEQALQAASDRELALKIQMNETQRAAQPATPPASRGWFSGVFTEATPPTSPSPVKSSQKSLTCAQQVEAASKAVQDKINPQEMAALLKWVTEGHLVEVEKLLKKNPTLGLGTGTVTDRSDRTFKNITVLQYAAWALDAEEGGMCELISKYIGAHHSAIQLKALAESPQVYSMYGASYDVTPLVNKYQTYLDNYSQWDSSKCCDYWLKEIGGEQRKCPAWLIYAWSEEGKDVAWTKQDPNRKIKREYDKHRLDWWFTENYNNGRGVGSSWGVFRGLVGVICFDEGIGVGRRSRSAIGRDMKGVSDFGTTRRETLQRLKNQVESSLQQDTLIPSKRQ